MTMNFAGTFHVNGARDRLWGFLTDPAAVAGCVPGFESLEVIDPARFKATVKAGIGPVRGKFAFDVTWQELTEPSRARMTAQGKAPGSAVSVSSSMDLSETADGGTDLAWTADVVVHGMIASVGARLLSGFAEKQTQQFFACLRARLEEQPPST
jgi:carbon monoxide dehydrogenase subunit G